MSRFDSLKENTFSSSRNRDNGNRDNGNREIRNRDNGNRMNNEKNRGEISNRNNTSSVPSFNTSSNKIEDFPELVKREGAKKKIEYDVANGISWQNVVKQRQEEENRLKEGMINQHDPKYWRGATWIGPMLIRQKNYPEYWYEYMENAVKGHASSYICPRHETEYSRDGINWHSSWNETFSEVQLLRMEYEDEEEHKMEQYRILEEYRERLEKESERYYEETGELDGYAIAELERIAYDKYAEQFNYEIPLEENNENDNIESDDYLEDDD